MNNGPPTLRHRVIRTTAILVLAALVAALATGGMMVIVAQLIGPFRHFP